MIARLESGNRTILGKRLLGLTVGDELSGVDADRGTDYTVVKVI